jgi:CHAD domain-containing protein
LGAVFKTAVTKKRKRKQTHLTIKKLADQRIWKVYQRLLKEGSLINDASPAEALHDLRKVCKKLRYLMEFFQSLYDERKIKQSIKVLKKFQVVLGDFQDYEVQENSIKHFSEEMLSQNVAANTLLAMGVLVQYLDGMKCIARESFSEQFTAFKQVDNQLVFKALFKARKRK